MDFGTPGSGVFLNSPFELPIFRKRLPSAIRKLRGPANQDVCTRDHNFFLFFLSFFQNCDPVRDDEKNKLTERVVGADLVQINGKGWSVAHTERTRTHNLKADDSNSRRDASPWCGLHANYLQLFLSVSQLRTVLSITRFLLTHSAALDLAPRIFRKASAHTHSLPMIAIIFGANTTNDKGWSLPPKLKNAQ